MIINTNLTYILTLALSAAFLTACNQTESQVSKHQLWVFGTVVEINVWSDNLANTQQAVDEISSTFNAMHHQWHAWKPGRLSDINRALRAGESIQLIDEERQFMQQTIDLSKQSNYFFNPAIGELIHLWGFHADDYPLLTPPPTAEQIKTLTAQNISVDNLKINGMSLRSDNLNIWLDFGGIAKGYAIDQAVEILNKHHIDNAIINAGGDLRSIGSKDKIPWRVAIQSPTDWSMLAEIMIKGDESVFTSGNYQRYKEFDGQRYSHIINPTTGMPVVEIVSATVIAENGILADAAATALVVAGDQWPQIANNMNINQVLIINEQLQCFGTPAMLSRLENLTIACQVVD
jgi:thiamine biosynthesis lipoprotein